jgi:CRP-like cAMP-binding protein
MLSPAFHINHIDSIIEKQFLEKIKAIGKPKSFKKGKTIIRQGSHPAFFFYIINGGFKTYFTLEGKQYIIGFTFNGDVDCCPSSLLSRKPNNFSIEAIADSQVLICDINDFRNSCKEQEYFLFVNVLLIKYLGVIESRMADSISLTAEQRYKQLIKLQPNEVNQIPLTSIAAFLGISPERLSRIRKKIKV